MRPKDESKKRAIIKATVTLVNELGFVACSVQKIAREAKVSPATLYVYYDNKDDLLVSTYMDIKRDISRRVLQGFDETLPLRDIFKQTWMNLFEYIIENREAFQFTEQFANSPYSERVDRQVIERLFEPLIIALIRGIEQKIIKNVNMEILAVFLMSPVMTLSNPRVCHGFEPTRESMEIAFGLAWDAVKY